LSESSEQKKVIEWFKIQYPQFKKRIFAIPNGAYLSGDNRRRAMQMSKLKAEGLAAGVSDLFIAVAKCKHGHGLFLEMKDTGKTLADVSGKQKDFIKEMMVAGYAAEWAAGFDEARAIINAYLKGKE
jgi:hypothetical protein